MLYLDGVVIAFGILMLVVIWLRYEDRSDKIIWALFIFGGLGLRVSWTAFAPHLSAILTAGARKLR
jgi:hypothetical protein